MVGNILLKIDHKTIQNFNSCLNFIPEVTGTSKNFVGNLKDYQMNLSRFQLHQMIVLPQY